MPAIPKCGPALSFSSRDYLGVVRLAGRRHASSEASGVPRLVKGGAPQAESEKENPTADGFGWMETLSGWGARYSEEKARRLDVVLS